MRVRVVHDIPSHTQYPTLTSIADRHTLKLSILTLHPSDLTPQKIEEQSEEGVIPVNGGDSSGAAVSRKTSTAVCEHLLAPLASTMSCIPTSPHQTPCGSRSPLFFPLCMCGLSSAALYIFIVWSEFLRSPLINYFYFLLCLLLSSHPPYADFKPFFSSLISL